jgi:hypothetical protein
MNRARVFRNLDRRQEFFGLEPVDLFALAALGWLLMMIAPRAFAWNLLTVVGTAVLLRVLKRGKSPGYLVAILRFYFFRRAPLCGAARDCDARARRGSRR